MARVWDGSPVGHTQDSTSECADGRNSGLMFLLFSLSLPINK